MAITFNGTALEVAGVLSISSITERSAPPRLVERLKIANADGSKLTAVVEDEKIIEVEGWFTCTDTAALLSTIDGLKNTLAPANKILDIDGRQYRVTWTGTLDIPRRPGTIKNAPYKYSFLCCDPYAYDASYSIGNWNAITATTHSVVIGPGGSKNPLMIVTYTLATAGNVSGIELKNLNNQQRIKHDNVSAYANGDIVIFDCEQKKVFKNGTEVDYSGVFPEWDVGNNTMYTSFISSALQLDQKNNVISGAEKWPSPNDPSPCAQSFIPAISGTRPRASFLLAKNGSPPNALTVDWCNDGTPAGTKPGTVIQSATILAASVPDIGSGFQWIPANPATPPNLTASTRYWHKLSSVAGDTYNRYRVVKTEYGQNKYANGLYAWSIDSGATWINDTDDDLYFEDYVNQSASGHSVNIEAKFKARYR